MGRYKAGSRPERTVTISYAYENCDNEWKEYEREKAMKALARFWVKRIIAYKVAEHSAE